MPTGRFKNHVGTFELEPTHNYDICINMLCELACEQQRIE